MNLLHWLYKFMVYTTNLELTLARSAPVVNMPNVAWLGDRLAYWESQLSHLEWRIG